MALCRHKFVSSFILPKVEIYLPFTNKHYDHPFGGVWYAVIIRNQITGKVIEGKMYSVADFSCRFQELVEYLKYTCPAHLYATSISPPAAQQIISSIKVVLGEDGTSRGMKSSSSQFRCSNISPQPRDFSFICL